MRTLVREGIEFGNFILIASIHLWNQSTENSMSSSPLGCDFATSLIRTEKQTITNNNANIFLGPI